MKTLFTLCFYVGLIFHSFSQAVTCTVTCGCTSCFGMCDASATINVIGGTLPYTYFWSGGTTTSAASGLCPGTVTCTVTDAMGNFAWDSCFICQPSALSNSVTPTNSSCTTCNNGSATATANGGSPPYTYSWSNGQSTQTATGLSPGTYTIIIADSHGCNNTTTITITSASGIDELSFENIISIYPNPTNGIFSIQSSEKISSIEIYSVLGEKIYSSTHQLNNSITLDLSAKPNGIYFLQLRTEQGTATKKIIIQK
ncbi:MAG: T9SS type A sorting domain-containing protein [Bacteroidetes bacterium]|nr:T9SS type A sorting domain-containing protein [Bacteroidota bacterium]